MSDTRKSEEIRRLLEEHIPATYRFAMHFLGDHHAAQDVVQETMLRGWKNRTRLKNQASGRSWLLRITANLCRDRLRKQRHPASQTSKIDESEIESRESPTGDAIANEQITQIRAALAALPEHYRTVIHLYSIEKLSTAEIAKVTGDRVGAIKTRLSRARKQMREMLEKRGVFEEGPT